MVRFERAIIYNLDNKNVGDFVVQGEIALVGMFGEGRKWDFFCNLLLKKMCKKMQK